ncbi:hypothetical protein [Megasphaera stantonii]|uniref:hypothetical protein n=1 Tax=Megasphaera stantonii TaxID=2144175 RepID=UPI001E0136AF|nr:hypothetical protein [Megasphaera stantonii]HJE82648.1 hypothetical protein [Megasphaera stantonii]
MRNEADDYKMIDRAAGVAFSNLQKPIVPLWVNRQGRPTDKKDPDTFNGLSEEGWEYLLKLERDARKLQGLALFLGGVLVLFTIVAVIMYQAGWIIH